MAGDWIPVRVTLPDDLRVMGIAGRLGIEEDAVVGKLVRFWSWADQRVASGHLPMMTKRNLDRLVSHDGFADAMIAAKWLTEEDGMLVIPEFDKFLGRSGKRRVKNAEAAATYKKRRAEAGTCESSPGSSSRDDQLMTKRKPTEQNRTEDKSNARPAASGVEPRKVRPEDYPLPASIDTPEVRAAWVAWVTVRREKRQPPTPTVCKLAAEKLVEAGPAVAAACLRTSAQNGWTGLFPDRVAANGNGNGHAPKPNAEADAAFEAVRRVIREVPVEDADRYRQRIGSLGERTVGAMRAAGGAAAFRAMTDETRGMLLSRFRSAFNGSGGQPP